MNTDTGVLQINETGEMEWDVNEPWSSYKSYYIKMVTIGNGVTSIGEFAFYGCTNLTSITIPNSIISIGRSAFGNCANLTSITIPNSVIEIGGWSFSGCSSLAEITIPNGVKSISYSSFSGCVSLTEITVPSSVTIIENYAFRDCTSLESITFNSATPPVFESGEFSAFFGSGIFEDCTSLTTIYVPIGAKAAYEAIEELSEYDIVEIEIIETTFVITFNPNGGTVTPVSAVTAVIVPPPDIMYKFLACTTGVCNTPLHKKERGKHRATD